MQNMFTDPLKNGQVRKFKMICVYSCVFEHVEGRISSWLALVV